MSCFFVTPGPFASDPCSSPIHSPGFLHSAGDPFTLSSCHCQSLVPLEESRLEPVTAVEGSLAVVGEQCPIGSPGLVGGWFLLYPTQGQMDGDGHSEGEHKWCSLFPFPLTRFCYARGDSPCSAPETIVVTELVRDILPDHQTRQLKLSSWFYFVFNAMSEWIPLQVPASMPGTK